MNAPFAPAPKGPVPRTPQTQAADGLPRRAFRNADITRMIEAGVLDDEEPFELIEGEIVPMAPELDPHFRPRAKLVRFFNRALGDEYLVGSEGSLLLADDVELKPDLVVFPATLKSHDVRGPDVLLVVEVCATSRHRDFAVKAPIYAKYGVREYWILDVDRKVAVVFKEPSKRHGYGRFQELSPEAPLTPETLPQLTLRLSDIL
ncbi:MAG: Uma2 family endonuclease [Alphaproteobacteria bacterium]|nr:Uma2 family endonuclease [Alphaproteobacteria bacterium]